MKSKKKYIIFAILILGTLVRCICISNFPRGLHADEAYAGYEAWSILNFGTDSWGYVRPVYLTTWGSGMNAMYSYLCIPFVAFLGLNTFATRIPMAILSIISIWIFYKLLVKVGNDKIGMWGAFILAISPWHIMTARYGLESNLVPSFLLIAIYLTVLALDNNRLFPIAAFIWGGLLYCYALMWLFVPIFVVVVFLYALKYKKITDACSIVGAIIILFALAFPLILFVLVNMDVIPEIRNNFFSVPKLPGYRGGEVSATAIWMNIKKILKLIITQNDDLIWNVTAQFGVYYIFSTIFVIIGAIRIVLNSVKNIRKKQFSYSVLLILWGLVALMVGLVNGAGISFTRLNCFLPVLFILGATGLDWSSNFILKRFHLYKIIYIIVAVYLVCFGAFVNFYFTTYQDIIGENQLSGAKEALQFAMEKEKELELSYIVLPSRLRHSQVLYDMEYPTDKFIETVKWPENGTVYMSVEYFENFMYDESLRKEDAQLCIIYDSEMSYFYRKGYQIEQFDTVAVAWKE